jgi:hypothetical protein
LIRLSQLDRYSNTYGYFVRKWTKKKKLIKPCSVIIISRGLYGIKKIIKYFDLFGIWTHSGLIRLCRITPGIVPANQSLYKLEKQSG